MQATPAMPPIITATPAKVTIPATARPAGAGISTVLSPLPKVFHYEVTVRPANAPTAPDTEITGDYRSGAWQQSAQTRGPEADTAPAQEMIAVAGITYTRPAGEATWTRWPGIGFDAAYGLASPFTALRLFALAEQKARGEPAQLPGVPVPVYRTQAIISDEAIRQFMEAAAAAVAPDAAARTTLLEQVTPLAVSQTIMYWVADDGRIYQAAATLLTAGKDGQASPWMQVTWHFSGYDTAGAAIAAPLQYRDAPGPAAQAQPLPTAAAQTASSAAALRVRVFASPGVAADNLTVTVYPAGDTRQPVDWRGQADSQFSLPPGRYDVLVQMDYAQEWRRGLEVKAGSQTSQDITFDFGTLKLTVLQGGKPITADIVTYPAGNRQSWVDWRSDNPATIRLRAGVYDVEVAYNDYKGRQTVTGIQVKAGEVTEQTVNVGQ